MAGKVFISYRRDDDPAYAGWLHDRLVAKFGESAVFRDVDVIEPGVDFVDELSRQVAECDFFVAVIGDQWLDARNDTGGRRLDDPRDFVRIEIEAALAREIRIVPVLVGGASMPVEEELPESLRPLARRNAIRLTHERFGTDSNALFRAIETEFVRREESRQKLEANSQGTPLEQQGVAVVPETAKGPIGGTISSESDAQQGNSDSSLYSDTSNKLLATVVFLAGLAIAIYSVPILKRIMILPSSSNPVSVFEGILGDLYSRVLYVLFISLISVFVYMKLDINISAKTKPGFIAGGVFVQIIIFSGLTIMVSFILALIDPFTALF